MKIRSGFVSNSSSSSFVFALPKNSVKKCPTCGRSNDPKDLAKIFESDYEGVRIEYRGTAKGLLDFYTKDYARTLVQVLENEPWFKDMCEKIKALEQDMECFYCSVGYTCSGFVSSITEIKDVIIIQEGY